MLSPKELDLEWDKAKGVSCPLCGRDTLRLVAGRCSLCWKEANQEQVKQKELVSFVRQFNRQWR